MVCVKSISKDGPNAAKSGVLDPQYRDPAASAGGRSTDYDKCSPAADAAPGADGGLAKYGGLRIRNAFNHDTFKTNPHLCSRFCDPPEHDAATDSGLFRFLLT